MIVKCQIYYHYTEDFSLKGSPASSHFAILCFKLCKGLEMAWVRNAKQRANSSRHLSPKIA